MLVKLVANLKAGRKSKSVVIAVGTIEKLSTEHLRWKAVAHQWASEIAEAYPEFAKGRLRITVKKLEV